MYFSGAQLYAEHVCRHAPFVIRRFCQGLTGAQHLMQAMQDILYLRVFVVVIEQLIGLLQQPARNDVWLIACLFVCRPTHELSVCIILANLRRPVREN
jgi:hypothetical protein